LRGRLITKREIPSLTVDISNATDAHGRVQVEIILGNHSHIADGIPHIGPISIITIEDIQALIEKVIDGFLKEGLKDLGHIEVGPYLVTAQKLDLNAGKFVHRGGI
jgi:hypothetical protein